METPNKQVQADKEETESIAGEELIQAKNYSRKFWQNPDNAPSEETKQILAV